MESLEAKDVWPSGDYISVHNSAKRGAVEDWIEGLGEDGKLKDWPNSKHKIFLEVAKGFSVYTVVWD